MTCDGDELQRSQLKRVNSSSVNSWLGQELFFKKLMLSV